MATRPKTMKEIRAQTEEVSGEMMIYNCCKQLIKVHLKPPKGVDFYMGAQDIDVKPGQTAKFKKNRLWLQQVERLCKQGKLQVLSDSDKIAERAAERAAAEK